MMTLEIFVPVLPPTVNHMYRPDGRGGKILTDQARSFRELAGWEARTEASKTGWQYQDGQRLSLSLRLTFGTQQHQDIDNRIKATLDAIAPALGFNDSCIDRIVIERTGYDKGRPRCEVTLEVLSTARGAAARGGRVKVILMVSGPAKKYHGHPRLGWLLNPRAGASIRTIVKSGMPWACDNDCFKQLYRVEYLRMLKRVSGQPHLQWVVAPDVVADARATLARFRLWLPALRYYALPIAFAAQDGQESLPVPWDDIRCLFIGGSTTWKLSSPAARLIQEAHTRGKWVHVGRVSTLNRISHFDSLPVDSVDTTAVSRAPKHLRWMLERLEYQQQGFKHAA